MIKNIESLVMAQNDLRPFVYTTDNLSTFIDSRDGSAIIADHIDSKSPKYYKSRLVGDPKSTDPMDPTAEYEFFLQESYQLASEPMTQTELGGYLRGLSSSPEGIRAFQAGNTGWSDVNGLSIHDGTIKDWTGRSPGIVRNLKTGETLQTFRPEEA